MKTANQTAEFRRKIIHAVQTKYRFLRFSVWIGSIYGFTFGLVLIRSPLSIIYQIILVNGSIYYGSKQKMAASRAKCLFQYTSSVSFYKEKKLLFLVPNYKQKQFIFIIFKIYFYLFSWKLMQTAFNLFSFFFHNQ
jgi:hypothetical protein